jgi:iron complex transport system substrate-binding protein
LPVRLAIPALLAAAALAASATIGAAGCRAAGGGADAAPAGAPSNAAALSLAAPPQRIVSLAPNLTEFLFALGAGPQVVGVTRFCDFPPEAGALPKVGGLVDLDVETVLSLTPDLVVANEGTRTQGFLRPLEASGVPVYWTRLDSEADVYRVAEELGGLLARPAAGERLSASIRAGLAAVEARLHGAPPRRTVLVFGHEPLVVAGGGSFADALLRRAGALNVAGDTQRPFPVWSVEAAVRAAPEVIIDNWVGAAPPADLWARWPSIPAVRAGRVHRLEATATLRPGPRLPLALETLARLIHPERFGDAAPAPAPAPLPAAPAPSRGE